MSCKNNSCKEPLKHLQLEYHLVEHCNLNCAMCSHFSPLARPKFASLERYSYDMSRLSALFHNRAEYIMLLGGEPLLHPAICDFFTVTRRLFPEADIILYTNGLLLSSMDESFWSICVQKDIHFVLTKYPIQFDYQGTNALLNMHGINFEYCNTPGRDKQMKHMPLDVMGTQKIEQSFMNCDIGNRCVFLRDGHLFPCCVAPNIHHFNRHFGYKLLLTEQDSIDIHTEQITPEDILSFLAHSIPFCRYCHVSARFECHPWCITKHSVSEWT